MNSNQLTHLTTIRNDLEGLPEKSYPGDPWPQVTAWIAKARPFFRTQLTQYFPDFDAVTAEPAWPKLAGVRNEAFQRQKWHVRKTTTDSAVHSILSFLDSVIELQKISIDTNNSTTETFKCMLERFPQFVRQLSHRNRMRAPLQVEDEYDVQYILHALLRLYFDDIRAEEWTPSYAGGSSRMDFLVKSERFVVEAKMTRDGLEDSKIGDQLLIDIGRYRIHPDCDSLLCFVYNPEYKLNNPEGLQQDLEALSSAGLLVKVVIAPR